MNRIVVLFTFLVSFCGYSQPVTLSPLYAVEDAYTSSASPSTPFGGLGTLEVSKTASSTFRTFLKFNLDSIPANAVITSAILKLTPSGTENVTPTNSTQLYLDVCNTSWTEPGITHSSNISNNTFFATIGVSNLNSGKREFEVKSFVQAIVEGRLPNTGWRIRRSDELTNMSTVYFSRENATLSNRPQLVITYYLKSFVSAAAIVHTSTLTSSDGSISPTITNGSSVSKSYRWYDSIGTQIATTQNLTGIKRGWYGLKYFGSAIGDTTYQAFIVGTQCQNTSVTFAPGPNYIDDAVITSLVRGSGTTSFFHTYHNSGANINFGAERWTNSSVWYDLSSMMRFRLWIDPATEINSALLTLTGNSHNTSGRTNESEFDLITSNWTETGVAYNNAPTYTTTNNILINPIPTGNTNLTSDIAGFFNVWKANNPNNNGMLLQLQSYIGNSYTRMQFHSSDVTTAGNRPKVVFSIQAINNCDFSSHSQLVDKIDAGYATTFNNMLKFFFTEEYTIDSGKKLPLKIYNEDNIAIAGVDFNGSAIPGISLTLPAINYVTDKNFVALSLSGLSLTNGKFYTLEFTNTLGEKKYLKFKYTN